MMQYLLLFDNHHQSINKNINNFDISKIHDFGMCCDSVIAGGREIEGKAT